MKLLVTGGASPHRRRTGVSQVAPPRSCFGPALSRSGPSLFIPNEPWFHVSPPRSLSVSGGRDRDRKFTKAFDGVLSGNGTRVIKTPVRSRGANSYPERFVRTLRCECVAHVLILGERHLRAFLAEYAQV